MTWGLGRSQIDWPIDLCHHLLSQNLYLFGSLVILRLCLDHSKNGSMVFCWYMMQHLCKSRLRHSLQGLLVCLLWVSLAW